MIGSPDKKRHDYHIIHCVTLISSDSILVLLSFFNSLIMYRIDLSVSFCFIDFFDL